MAFVPRMHEETGGMVRVQLPISLPSDITPREQGELARAAVARALANTLSASVACSVSWCLTFVRLGPARLPMDELLPAFSAIRAGALAALALRPEDRLVCGYTQKKNPAWGVRIEIRGLRPRLAKAELHSVVVAR